MGERDPGFFEVVTTTRAIRRYRAEPVPDEDLSRMLFAATRAPSGSNRQPVRWVVLRDGPRAREARAVLGRGFRMLWGAKRAADGYDEGSGAEPDTPKARMAATMEHFVDHLEEVPVILLACYERWRDPQPSEGASVYPACQNLLLAARALGYGGVLTIWHQAVEGELKAVLGIPEAVVVGATITLGRPEGRHGPVRRLPLDEVVFEDGWDQRAGWASEPTATRHTRSGPPRRPGERR